METDLAQLILAAVISGGVASVLLGLLFRYFFEPRLARAADAQRSLRERKEQSLFEVLGPIYMSLERSRRAFERWERRNDYLEGRVVKEATPVSATSCSLKVICCPSTCSAMRAT